MTKFEQSIVKLYISIKILVKKSTNIRQNLKIILRNGHFQVKNQPIPAKKLTSSRQNLNDKLTN